MAARGHSRHRGLSGPSARPPYRRSSPHSLLRSRTAETPRATLQLQGLCIGRNDPIRVGAPICAGLGHSLSGCNELGQERDGGADIRSRTGRNIGRIPCPRKRDERTPARGGAVGTFLAARRATQARIWEGFVSRFHAPPVRFRNIARRGDLTSQGISNNRAPRTFTRSGSATRAPPELSRRHVLPTVRCGGVGTKSGRPLPNCLILIS
jgi:hypothetical protein